MKQLEKQYKSGQDFCKKTNKSNETGFWRLLSRNIFVPNNFQTQKYSSYLEVLAIIPSFKPGKLCIKLVEDLIKWNPNLIVCVVDDATPKDYEAEHHIFEKIRAISKRVLVLRTPENKLKAGAINKGILHFLESEDVSTPDIILTLDDDVVISEKTVKNLVENLLEDDSLGAVCSQCRVINKNQNFLTRLQGLEYFGFNTSRIADERLLYGPIVMHGMLTAFRTQALKDAGFFAEKHLIEDYEVTANIKKKGKWHVRLAPYAYAWTEVPYKFNDLWRQRTRWNVGGLFVITEIGYWRSVFQDIIGHFLFIFTFVLIILSLVFYGERGSIPNIAVILILVFSITPALMWYFFQLWLMRFYKEGDWKDRLIRASIIPEFLYANLLSIILLGSYVFFTFYTLFSWVEKKTQSHVVTNIKRIIELGFARIGYTRSWGTRID